MKRSSSGLGWIVATIVALTVFTPADAARKLKYYVLKPPGLLMTDVRSVVVPAPQVSSSFDDEIGSLRGFVLRIGTEIIADSVFGANDVAPANRGSMLVGGIEPAGRGRLRYASAPQPFEVISDTVFREAAGLEETSALQTAARLGADAIVLGWIRNDGEARDYKREFTDDQGESREVSCRAIEVRTTVRVRVVRVEDGSPIGSRVFTEDRSRSACSWPFALPAPDELALENMGHITEQLCNHLSPYYEHVSLAFQRTARKHRRQARQAFDHARDHRFDEARAVLSGLLRDDANDPTLHYNLGLLERAAGRLDAAEQAFAEARSLKRCDCYEDAIRDVLRRRREIETLAGIGVELDPPTILAIR